MPCHRIPGTGTPATGEPFLNWAQNVTANPQRIYTPNSLDELVAIVKEAEANQARVRAFGSGWSFTDVMLTPDYLVSTDSLNAILSETMTGNSYPNDPVFEALTAEARARSLCHVQAGIKIHDLHDQLENNFKTVPGVNLPDGPGGRLQPHGYALKTLGGSGGQSIIGAISTSTHGGDDHDNNGNLIIRPLPDMAQGIHLVGAGGAEFFIQRRGTKAIVDVSSLGKLLPCVAGPGQIISNDDIFNAVLVSVGRMGIVYSVVLEVRQQFFLKETISQSTWNQVNSDSTIAELRVNNRFVQVLILPYPDDNGDHTCFVTTRNEVEPSAPGNAPGKNIFNYVCDLPPPLLVVWVAAIIAGLVAAASESAGLLSLIPIVGPILAGIDAAAATAAVAVLAPLLNPSTTIEDYLAAAENLMSQLGLFSIASGIVNKVLASFQTPGDHTDISFKIMDTYDYQANCYKALSMEAGFDADDTVYLGYVQKVFDLVQNYASQHILVGAYISLRYCGGSEALLAIEQWPHTVCIEIAALAGLSHDAEVLAAFEQEAANRGAAVHWGLLNNRSRSDIEATFPRIDRWRAALIRLSKHGALGAFDNDFCLRHGLEVFDTQTRTDVSYLTQLLLGDAQRPSRDLSYLVPLLA